MRTIVFANRTLKEVLREPLNLIFGLGLPVILLLLMSIIQLNIPIDIFNINNLAPGIAIFGLSFMSLFTAQTIAKDRSTSFLTRLYTTPMKSMDFLFGYALPMIPISLLQSIICYIFALMFKLKLNADLLIAILGIIPTSLLFISMGLLFGSVLNMKAVGGVCGALITNLTALFSGIWFDLSLMGDTFNSIVHILPFAHCVELQRALVSGNYDGALVNFLVILAYTIIITSLSIILFLRQMKRK